MRNILFIIVGIIILSAMANNMDRFIHVANGDLKSSTAIAGGLILIIGCIIGYPAIALLIAIAFVLMMFLVVQTREQKAKTAFVEKVNANGLACQTSNLDVCTEAADDGLVIEIGQGVYMAKPLYEKLTVIMRGDFLLRRKKLLKIVNTSYPSCSVTLIPALMTFLLNNEKTLLVPINFPEGEACALTIGLYNRCIKLMSHLGAATEEEYRKQLAGIDGVKDEVKEELVLLAPSLLQLMERKKVVNSTSLSSFPGKMLYKSLHRDPDCLMTSSDLELLGD